MDRVYLALPPRYLRDLDPDIPQDSQIITDEHALAKYIKHHWECYLFTGLKKIESVETTVIESNETV